MDEYNSRVVFLGIPQEIVLDSFVSGQRSDVFKLLDEIVSNQKEDDCKDNY